MTYYQHPFENDDPFAEIPRPHEEYEEWAEPPANEGLGAFTGACLSMLVIAALFLFVWIATVAL